ncbi:putative Diguanylate cyclase [Desulfamplus magnetovallimortis]|uniref:Putative Diguanylate cyclase n=1 Tax=Desulfamplus magnetovallimortis TaxID=1246637 RepID=A0A1W1HFA3_9BACT|nr:sensor domain-containing diguanylate cyclase [Desulfamplus magnetovallimortis]SLM31103.1 putative Diguanylate cyclase [Desulfamplus magnetovallimortis]
MDINKVKDLDTAAFFIEVGKPLAKAKTIKETLDILMYQVGCIFQPMNWSLLLKEPKTGDMVFTVVVGANKDKLQGVRIPKGEGIAGHILKTGESLIVEKVVEDERFSMRMDEATGFKTQSIIGVPLKTDDKIFGVIELINKISGDNFTEMEMQVLSSIAEYAAIAIERSYYNQALKKIALTDSLTGLRNKISFERFINNRIEVLKRYNVNSSLLMIDIRDFKSINNKYGYNVGDRLLKEFAKFLHTSFRAVDEVFRYDADKFAVVMPQTSLGKTQQARQRLLTRLESALFLGGKVSISANVAIRLVDIDIHNEIQDIINKKGESVRLESNRQSNINNENLESGTLDSEKNSVKADPSDNTLSRKRAVDNQTADNSAVKGEDVNFSSEIKAYPSESSGYEDDEGENIHDMENNLQPMLDEEDLELQRDSARNKVQYKYKDVMLPGDYRHFNKNTHGYITVVKISIRAVCFETMRSNTLKPGDIVDVSFTLDDERKSLIKRRVQIDSVDDKMVEAQYYNPPPYDKNLGFYMMA